MWTAKVEEASMGILEADHTIADCPQEVEMGKKLQGKYIRISSPESPAKLYCCFAVIMVLTAAVVALFLTLSGLRDVLKEQCKPSDLLKEEKAEVRTEKLVISTPGPCCATCPNDWIGFGNKCFYFSEDMRNWTFSQTSCLARGAQLARFDTLEELNFLKRCVVNSHSWIDLQRESIQHPWKWTDNTEYNNLVPVEGEEKHAFLTGSKITSSRDYLKKHWVCSKSNSYTSQYSVPSRF